MVQCARLEENTNRVLEVIESNTLKWCKKYLEGVWVKNSTDKRVSVDCIYYPERDMFSYQKPYPSWILDDDCVWQPPVLIRMIMYLKNIDGKKKLNHGKLK